jgi:peptide subunit release factor RF-3
MGHEGTRLGLTQLKPRDRSIPTGTGKILDVSRRQGEVKARGGRRRVRSDWMAAERERAISVSSAAMSFEHASLAFNLLDAPGDEDFSPPASQRRQCQ